MSDLTDFLLARISDDEAATIILECGCGEGVAEVDPLPGCPARVLVECEAKRAILDELILARAGDSRRAADARWGLEFAARALALPYADHPDYREVWVNG
jgi:hypothetical protein